MGNASKYSMMNPAFEEETVEELSLEKPSYTSATTP